MARFQRAAKAGVVALLLAACGAFAAPATDAFPGAAKSYLVELDGVALFAAAPKRPLPPASLAKLMTALLVAEGTDARAIVTVSPRAAAATGARAGLRAGERLLARDLMAAMLMASANDACLALAEHVAGSERAFVERMNARAQSMRLEATTFVNACGHDAPRMLASATDLAALASATLAQPAIAEWTGKETHAVRTLDGREIALRTTNAFVGRVPGVTGLKTGYTSKAGRNLVLTATREGHRVTVVMLGARDRWWDAAAMLERAFDAARAPR